MAGFLGFFNYEKEGPGVSKNAPKKKTFIVLFETFFRNFWKLINVNLVFSLVSFPLVTVGLANVGLTHVARSTARDKHSFGVSDFFEAIKKNWKQGLAAGIINVIVFALLTFAIIFYSSVQNATMSAIGLGLAFMLSFIFLVMNFYIWTLMITFKYTLKQIYRNSFQFVFLNLKNNLICGISLLLIYALYIGIFMLFPLYVVFVILLFLIVCTFPAFKFLLIQYCVFPAIIKHIIEPYYRERPDEDIELRRNLGLEVPEDDEEDDEDNFSDDVI